jgi:hypothetical protein
MDKRGQAASDACAKCCEYGRKARDSHFLGLYYDIISMFYELEASFNAEGSEGLRNCRDDICEGCDYSTRKIADLMEQREQAAV